MDQSTVDQPVESIQPRLDPLAVYKLRRQNQLTFAQIGQLHSVSTQAAHACYQSFLEQIGSSEDVASYEQAKTGLLSHVEERLVASCLDADKLQKASLNNIAYALTQVHTALRLEKNQSTSNVGLFSKIVQQVDADLFEDTGKKRRKGA